MGGVIIMFAGAHCLGQMAAAFIDGKSTDTKPAEQNYKKALALARRSAEMFSAIGQLQMGYLYDGGYADLEKDEEEAFRWFKLAADQNHPEALNALASCYFNGDGVSQDFDKAFDLYQRAADLGLSDALVNVGRMYQFCIGPCKIPAGVNPRSPEYQSHVAENMRHAFKCFDRAQELDNPRGCLNAAVFLYNGYLSDNKPEIFASWQLFQKGAKLGDAMCMANVAKLYDTGICINGARQLSQDYG